MKIKRDVLYVESSKVQEVKEYLTRNGILWSNKTYFKWDWNTAVVTAIAVSLLFVLAIALAT